MTEETEKREIKRASAYTSEEAAEILGVRVETVRLWCHDKRIPAYKAGTWRIPAHVIDDIATGKETLPPPPEERREKQRKYHERSTPGAKPRKEKKQ